MAPNRGAGMSALRPLWNTWSTTELSRIRMCRKNQVLDLDRIIVNSPVLG